MTEDRLRTELYGSFKNRAMIYYETWQVLKAELGEERAADLMKQAIYNRGLKIGEQFKGLGGKNVQALKEAFLKIIPDQGAMFAPEVQHDEADAVDIKFHRCPLKEAWLDAGVPEGEVAKLCHIAGRVDNGTFEGAGFGFWADTWQPGRDGCCHLHLRPGD